LARELAIGKTEAHWRGAVIHAYYALLLECRDALARWGFPVPAHQNVHPYVRLRFTYAGDGDLKHIGKTLDILVRLRNQASYDLRVSKRFTSNRDADQAAQDATSTLALLDQIDSDPGRRAAAMVSIKP